MMDTGESAQRRRVRILLGATTMFVLMQVVALGAGHRIEAGHVRAVDVAQLIAPTLLAAGIMRGLFGAPLWLRDAHARRAVNDELVVDNRRRAVAAGMLCAVIVALLVSFVSPFVALRDFEVAHAILFALVVAPVSRFVWLERQGASEERNAAE